MNDLPTPMSRIECYLAVAAGMDGVTLPEAPESRLEDYLAYIAGDTSITLPTPASLTELWLNYVATGISSDEMKLEGAYYIGGQKVDVRFFAVAGGMEGVIAPAPQNRTEEYWAKIAEIRPIHGVLKYATGTNIVLTDVVSGLNSLENIYGDTTQQTYSGKNLFDTSNYTTNGSELTIVRNSDGSFTVNGTSTATYQLLFTNTITMNGDYTIATIGEKTVEQCYFNIYKNSDYTSTISYVNTAANNHYKNFTTAETSLSQNLNIAAGTYNNFTFRLVIVKGTYNLTTIGDFEPYVGGIPSPNPDYPQTVNVVAGTQSVAVAGRNLWDFTGINPTSGGNFTSSFEDGELSVNWTGGFNLFPTNGTGNSVALDGTQTYTLSAKVKGSSLIFKVRGGSEIFRTTTTTEYTQFSGSFTGVSSLRIDIIRLQSISGSASIKELQLEVGPAATDYQPFAGMDTYTIDLGATELCKIGTYQDYIYKSGDDWYVHKEIGKYIQNTGLTLNTQTAEYIQGLTPSLSVAPSLPRDTFADMVICDKLISATQNYMGISGTNLYSQIRLTVPISFASNISEMSALLSNMKIYYVLASATDTQITDNTLIGQLDALNSAVLPKPNATITVTPTGTNLAGSLKISYMGEEE